LMDHLARLGLADRTLVLFAGDNGSARPGLLDGNLLSTGNKSKGHTFDISVHVPLVIRAPFLIKEPRVSEALVDFTDLFPTFAEVAGAPVPDGWTLDGHSLVPVLAGNSERTREWISSQLGRSRIVRNQRFKLDSDGGLFDLQNDPLEKQDLRDSTRPEIAAARQRLAEVLNSLPSDSPAPFEGYRGTLRRKRKAKR
jgi:arylsulfatase A